MNQAARSLRALVDRYDPEVSDLSGSDRLRIRLVCGTDTRDVVADRQGARLESSRSTPDARLTADAATWGRIATNVRGGLDAFRTGGLIIRRNLHAGVGSRLSGSQAAVRADGDGAGVICGLVVTAGSR